MAELWIVNASPLIALSAVFHEHLLSILADQYVVPESVIDELTRENKNDRANELALKGLFPVVSDPEPVDSVIRARLGPGETAVLSFAAKYPGWTAIMDDKAARRCANTLEIPVKGVIGIAIQAQRQNVIPSARHLLRSVRDAGLYLNERVIAVSLKMAFDDTW